MSTSAVLSQNFPGHRCWPVAGFALGLLLSLALASGVLAADVLRFDFSPSPEEVLLARTGSVRPQALAAPRTAAPPSVDGRLDDGVWDAAARSAEFSMTDPATSFRVCFDDRALYVAIECTDVPGRERVASVKPRDGGVHRDDCIEIWIATAGPGGGRYHFIINATGSTYDACNEAAGYDPDWEHAVETDEAGWTVEMAIPLAAIGLEEWRPSFGFNIGRNVPGVGPGIWSGKWGGAESGTLTLDGVTAADAAAPAEGAPSRSRENIAVTGRGLSVRCRRTRARPQDRTVDVDLNLVPGRGGLTALQLTGRLAPVRSSQLLAEVTVTPERSAGRVTVDMRVAQLEAAILDLVLRSGDEIMGAATLLLGADSPESPLAPAQRIPVHLSVPEGVTSAEAFPVTFGVPFPAGVLWDTGQIRLVDRDGAELPHQTEVAGRWARDGAIKWVRVDALANPDRGCFVEATPSEKPATALSVVEESGHVVVETAGARYVLAKGASPIAEVFLDGKLSATAAGTRGLYVVDQNGRCGSASAAGESVVVESRGPAAACVRLEGFYRDANGEQMARHLTRVECFAGRREARITHTLILTRDTNDVWFREVGWEFAVRPGSAPAALFGTAREPWNETTPVPLTDRTASAYMLQEDHYYYGHGESRAVLREVSAGGAEATLATGVECGDWAALTGQDGGLMLNCRETARQHPKELEVSRDRIVLRLFSNRTGQELDFRAATLVKKWHLTDWLDEILPGRFRYDQENETTAKLTSNALGWAKTHDITLMPLPAGAEPTRLARLSKLQRDPVYATADPAWLYTTRALGRLHPKDADNYPVVEKVLDDLLTFILKRREEWGEYGFLDYPGFAPHAGGYPKAFRPRPKRNFISYALPHGAWLQYARSGERRVRDYAAGLTRFRNDAIQCHWEGPNRIRGFYNFLGADKSDGSAYMDLPFYWGTGRTLMFCPNVTMVNDLTWGWYLTGDRRYRDCLDEYADALRQHWTPAETKRAWRITWDFGRLIHLYEYTWDPLFGAMASLTGEALHDPESSFEITSEQRLKSYSSTYKIWIDLRDILAAWRVFGDERYYTLARKISEHTWGKRFLKRPIHYDCADGIVASFLYHDAGRFAATARSTGEAGAVASAPADSLDGTGTGAQPDRERGRASIAESLRIKFLQLAEAQRRGEAWPGQSSMAFFFEGIPLAQDILDRHEFGRQPIASWAAAADFGSDIAFCTRKERGQAIGFLLWSDQPHGFREPWRVGSIDLSSTYGADVATQSCGWLGDRVELFKDVPTATVAMRPATKGVHEVLADRTWPLVLYAPSYWQPALRIEPMPRVYFDVPEGETEGQIFFEGTSRVYAPDGSLFGLEEGHSGWVTFPGDNPGLWSFQSTDNKLIRVRNLPPLFAFDRPENYFAPNIEWSREKAPAPVEPTPAAKVYVSGAVDVPGNQALFLTGRRQFELDGGPLLADGTGREFLPSREGTIEFFLKPEWGSFDDVSKPMHRRWLLMPLDEKHTFRLFYKRDPQTRYWQHTHALETYLPITGRKGWIGIRTHRRLLIERGRWVHVALVWGYLDKDKRPVKEGQKGGLDALIFVDGKRGMSFHEATGRYAELRFVDQIRSLTIPGDIHAAIDELRVSDIARYADDFAPPSRTREFGVDPHTRALFHFNGNIEGACFAGEQALPVRLTP